MVTNLAEHSKEERLNRVFHALSDPTRRHLLRQLTRSSEGVTALAEPHKMSLNAVSKHLKVLEGAGLIQRDNRGRSSICSLSREPLLEAQTWIDQNTQFWNETLDVLANHMDRGGADSDDADD